MRKIHLILFLLTSFLLSACFDSRDENTWLVGTSADNPPYEFIKDGEIVGFDIDLMTEIARHLGKKVKFKNLEFRNLLASLSAKDIDFIIAGLSITSDRLERADFSIPYASARIAVLYNGKNNFHSFADLASKNVGAQLGSIWNLIAYDLSLKNDFKVTTMSNNLKLVEELRSKNLDAVVLEESQADEFIKKYPEFAKFTDETLGSSFAIAMPKNYVNKKNINHTIKTLKSNGTIASLSQKWGLVGASN